MQLIDFINTLYNNAQSSLVHREADVIMMRPPKPPAINELRIYGHYCQNGVQCTPNSAIMCAIRNLIDATKISPRLLDLVIDTGDDFTRITKVFFPLIKLILNYWKY